MTATEGSNSGLGFDTQDVPSFQPQIPSLFSVHQALEQLKTDERYKPFFAPDFSVAKYTQELLRAHKQMDPTFLKIAIQQLDNLIKMQVSEWKENLLREAGTLTRENDNRDSSLVKQSFSISNKEQIKENEDSDSHERCVHLEDSVHSVSTAVAHLSDSVRTLQTHLTQPVALLRQRTHQLHNVQEVNHTLRKLLQFLYLTRKFKHHLDDMNNRDLLKAAHYLVQLEILSQSSELRGIHLVEKVVQGGGQTPSLADSRTQLIQQTYAQLREAVDTRSQAAIAHVVYVFHTLSLLTPQLTQLCTDWITALQRSLHLVMTQQPPPTVWHVLNQLLEQIGAQHEALSVLYRVLIRLPHSERADRLLVFDLLSHPSLHSNDSPSLWFHRTLTSPWWNAILTLIQNQFTCRIGGRTVTSSWDAFETLSSEYPRLVRHLGMCVQRWSVSRKSGDDTAASDDISTELLSGEEIKGLFRAFSACETEYFKRVTSRLHETIEELCTRIEKLRTTPTPTTTTTATATVTTTTTTGVTDNTTDSTESEGHVSPVPEVSTFLTLLREETERVVTELTPVGLLTTTSVSLVSNNSPLLSRFVKSIVSSLRLLLLKIDKLIATELPIYYVSDSMEVQTSRSSQSSLPLIIHNARLFNTLHVLFHGVREIVSRIRPVEESVLLQEVLHTMEGLGRQILEPLFFVMTKHCERTLIGALQPDYSDNTNSISSTPGNITKLTASERSDSMPCSPYIKILKRQILTFRTNILSKFTSSSSLVLAQSQTLARRIVVLFLRYSAMIRPLSESNEQTMKIKLINDMAHLELALSPLVGSNLSQLGDVYKMLRAFNTLLFTETHLILSTPELTVLPLTVIAHHLFSRAPKELLLPYKTLGWTVQQYVEYLDTHTEQEIWQHALVKSLENYQRFINKNEIKQFPEVYSIFLSLGERIMKGEGGGGGGHNAQTHV